MEVKDMMIQRWHPLRELHHMDEVLNRLWRDRGSLSPTIEEEWNIPLDVVQKQDSLVVKASLPGVDPTEVQVSIEDSMLSIKAEVVAGGEEDTSYLLRERRVGSFFRTLQLPETVDTAKVESFYENGVLTIILPKLAEKMEKKIKIKVGKAPLVVEGK